MPGAEDIGLQAAYERALRMGNPDLAGSILSQIQMRARQTRPANVPAPNADQEFEQYVREVEERDARFRRGSTNIPASVSEPVLTPISSTTVPRGLNVRQSAVRNLAAERLRQNLNPGDLFETMGPEYYSTLEPETYGRDIEEPVFDINDFADAEDIEASTRRQPITRGEFIEPPSEFQNFLNNINTQTTQGARIQELVNKNPKLAEKIFNTSVGLGSQAFKAQEKISGINDQIYAAAENLRRKYQQGEFIPGFIAKPLGLNNPLVEAGGIVSGGARLNPQGIRFLQEQKDLGSVLDRTSLDALGGRVNASYVPKASITQNRVGPLLDIAFQSATGYSDPSSLKRSKADAAKQIQRLQAELETPNLKPSRQQFIQENLKLQNERLQNFSEELLRSQKLQAEYPLTSEAIRYQLGSAISAAPEGTTIAARPIGGAEGGRARLYKGMSKGALETIPKMNPLNPTQLPTDEEFRLAREGGGFTPTEHMERAYASNSIATLKEGPEQFKTWRGQTINWNPEELKDPMIRASLGLSKDVDVAGLRQDPTGIFINKRPFDPSLPVITTQSPQYVTRQAIKGTAKAATPATKGFLLDAGINYALGASPQEALVTAISDPISAENLGGAPTAAIERLGPQGQFVDTRSNTVLSPEGRYTNTGIAYKGGKPIVVPRGSVAGEGNIMTQAQQVFQNAAAAWKKRLGALGIFGR